MKSKPLHRTRVYIMSLNVECVMLNYLKIHLSSVQFNCSVVSDSMCQASLSITSSRS